MSPLVLADDQPAVPAGLRMRLALENDIQIIGAARDGNKAVYVAHRLNPDIAILTIHDNETSRQKTRGAGAAGFVSRHTDQTKLLNAIPRLALKASRRLTRASQRVGGITGLVIAPFLVMLYVANTMGS